MSTKFKFEMESDGLTEAQAKAFSTFVNSLQTTTKTATEEVKAVDEKAEEVKPKRRRKVVKQETPEKIHSEDEGQGHTLTIKQEAPKQEVEEPKQEAPKQEVEEPKQEVEEPKQESSLTIQDVRAKLQPLVKTHRDEIIAKLKEFGAKSVTALDPKHFSEMYTFLDSFA